VATLAGAAEKSISRSELPAAVKTTTDEQSKGATVRGYSTDRENGKLEYEVEMLVNGHTKDVTIAPDGRLLEIEEEVSLNSLSTQVRSGLAAQAGKGKITKIESLTKNGKIVAYEAQVLLAGKHSEVQVGPDGGRLAHEE
jgi:uncharacterized membrane protein YkoI